MATPAATSDASASEAAILRTVRRYWGFDRLRPLQREVIAAGLAQRDTLAVMATGGGKSLCYQVPPLVTGRTDVVISPLISLMKDQVDALRAIGYPAACLHSGMGRAERERVGREVAAGEHRLLFVSPERLLKPDFAAMVGRMNVGCFAVDEAHCISHWGHDFRPEYRQLAELRQRFPHASIHAFTATATPRVREDIAEQLQLRDPLMLVGTFDRPNLIYRVLPKVDVAKQTLDGVARHPREAVIVYCISRKETEELAAVLQSRGIRAAAYHAGLDAAERRRIQESFDREETDVVVATVAFGMGIDRPNVRCVLHTALPKSVEHYQQESGRAGRDGLEAECVLLYSSADAKRWESILQSGEEVDRDHLAAQLELLREMQQLCMRPRCRHAALSEYFGQTYGATDCGACDVCLGEVEEMADGTVTAQKILSCVARVGQRFGVGHVVDVLVGAETEAVRRLGHHALSTYGLMKEVPKKELHSLVHQLVDQGLLVRTDGDRPTLQLNASSWEVLRNQRTVQLYRPPTRTARTRPEADAWSGVDRGLLEVLRSYRQEVARSRGRPAFVVFDDTTLRSLARVRPTRRASLDAVHGMGERRIADIGSSLLELIRDHCEKNGLSTDQTGEAESARASTTQASTTQASTTQASTRGEAKTLAFRMFAEEKGIEEVMEAANRARSTVVGYLAEHIGDEAPRRIDRWVDDATYRRVEEAATTVNSGRLRPIYEHLGGQVPYETIRLVLAHIRATADP